MNIKAIETRYKGYRFRSRLEARWAVFFDALGLRWEYEKQGYHLPSGSYLPDFWLSDFSTWVEIKPEEPSRLERDLCYELCDALRQRVVIFVGVPDQSEYGIIVSHGFLWEKLDGWLIAEMQRNPDEYGGRDRVSKRLHDGGMTWGIDPITFGDVFGIRRPDITTQAYECAIEAARSARFEHGETPR